MAHLGLLFAEFPESFGLWMFLSIGAVALFVVFIPLVSWIDSRRKEREAFYRADMMRRLAEASGDSAKSAIEMLREQERLKQVKTLEGMKIGGVINVGVGIGLVLMMYSIGDKHAPLMVGAIPGLVGVAMLVYVYLLAAPVDFR